MTASISAVNECDALSRRRDITLPFCYFILWATNSSISYLVFVPIVAAITGSGTGCDAGGSDCWCWVLEVASSTMYVSAWRASWEAVLCSLLSRISSNVAMKAGAMLIFWVVCTRDCALAEI